jgi:DNA polymerase I
VAPALVIDTLSLFFRSFYALPPLTTSRGEPTSALFGFSSVLLKVWREHRPVAAGFARDLPRPTFRHVAWAPYKGTRVAPPDALRRQLGRFDELLAAFGFPVVTAEGFEADDVLATLAQVLPEPILVTGDHDCLQVARGGTRVLIVGRGAVKDRLYDEEAVRASFGVGPELVPDWIALVGDPSDNLPGVAGIGEKTAARLLGQFGSVAGILENIEGVTPVRTRTAIAEKAEELRVWRDLALLRYDVPLPPEPWVAPLTADARGRLGTLFETLEFRSLIPRLADL